MYKVVDEHVEKPKARGARLELCFQTPGLKFCTTLAKLSTPGTSISATLPFKVGETFVFFLRDMLSYTALRRAIRLRAAPSTPIAMGYRPGYITVKLVLDISLARDIVREVEL